MQINGPARVHGAQSINAPHRAGAAPKPAAAAADQLDLSSEADFVGQVHDLPDVRTDRVAQIRAEIAAGTYETDDKLDAALDRLLDEIG